MKKSRKIMSVLLVVAMLFTLISPAMAAEKTISVKAEDTHSYDVYQIFTGDLHEGVLSNIKWGVNGTGETGTSVSQTILDELSGTSGSDTAKLAVIQKYVDLTDDAMDSVSAGGNIEVPTGYYLFIDKGAVAEGEAYSLYVVQVVGDTTIAPKRGTVTSEKKVKDTNDSVADSATDWQDSADYDIGDAVPFQLKGTVPADYENYATYYYAFHDKESNGLDFIKDSVKVYVDGTEITTGYKVVTEGLTDDCTFEVVFANLKNISAVKAGSVITVEYTSTLNEKAAIGSAGNPNTMYLEYSNNPNSNGTGTTKEDKVTVFTYKVIVDKVTQAYNEDGTPKVTEDEKLVYEALAGAGFTLYKQDASGNYVAIGNEVKGDGLTTFEWKGLDDGNYKLEETTTPAGYNTIAPIEFTITANHEIKSDDPKLTDLNGNNGFTGEVTAGSLSTDVVNNTGATLPETGGMGTTIFYVVGGALVLGAAVLLVTRRRMAE